MKFKEFHYHNELVADQMKKLADLEIGLFESSTSSEVEEAPINPAYSKRFVHADEKGIWKNVLKVREKLASKIVLDTDYLEPEKYYEGLENGCRADFKKSALALKAEYAKDELKNDVFAFFCASDEALKAGHIVTVSMAAIEKLLSGKVENTLGVDTVELQKALDAYPAYHQKLLDSGQIFQELRYKGVKADIKTAVQDGRKAQIASYAQYELRNGVVENTDEGVVVGRSFELASGKIPPTIRKVLRVPDQVIGRAFPAPEFIAANV